LASSLSRVVDSFYVSLGGLYDLGVGVRHLGAEESPSLAVCVVCLCQLSDEGRVAVFTYIFLHIGGMGPF
jgi:hypothetical protein